MSQSQTCSDCGCEPTWWWALANGHDYCRRCYIGSGRSPDVQLDVDLLRDKIGEKRVLALCGLTPEEKGDTIVTYLNHGSLSAKALSELLRTIEIPARDVLLGDLMFWEIPAILVMYDLHWEHTGRFPWRS